MMRRPLAIIVTLLIQFVPAAVLGAELTCLDCHPDKKDNKVVHPAVEMGCESCHVGSHQGERPAPKLSAPVPDLCFTCHDKEPFEKKVQHPPVAGGMCTSCHNPHSSSQPKLLIAGIPGLCFTCHDKDSLPMKTRHEKAAAGACLTCHAPHSSDNPFILMPGVEKHCTSCHVEQRSGKHVLARVSPGDSHPVQGKPDPLHKGRSLSCTSCHNPHLSTENSIPPGSLPPAEICLHCHKKISIGR